MTRHELLIEYLATWQLFRSVLGFDADDLHVALTPTGDLQLQLRTQGKEAAVRIGYYGQNPEFATEYTKLAEAFNRGEIDVHYEQSCAKREALKILKGLLDMGFVVPNLAALREPGEVN